MCILMMILEKHLYFCLFDWQNSSQNLYSFLATASFSSIYFILTLSWSITVLYTSSEICPARWTKIFPFSANHLLARKSKAQPRDEFWLWQIHSVNTLSLVLHLNDLHNQLTDNKAGDFYSLHYSYLQCISASPRGPHSPTSKLCACLPSSAIQSRLAWT